MNKSSLKLLLLFLVISLSSCRVLKHSLYMRSGKAPKAKEFTFSDGGKSVYYSFSVGEIEPETYLFLFAATGCSSLKAHMPNYVDGLTISTKVFVLNKRFVKDRSSGLCCSKDFHLVNNLDQWVSDYAEFILNKINSTSQKPKHVVLLGVSEAAITSVYTAKKISEITHLAIIGDGGLPMRAALNLLEKKGVIPFDVKKGLKKVSTNPESINKKWFGNTYRWWTGIIDINPTPTYLALDIPIFIGMGEKDNSVPIESLLFLEKEFENANKNNLLTAIYPDAGHTLSSSKKSYRKEYFNQLSEILKTN